MIDFFRQVGRSLVADWRGPAEIAVLACLLYAVFRFLRGTRGASALRAAFFAILAALAVLFLVAQAAGLARVVWMVERLAALAAVGVLVIFQPEIRAGLVRLGQSRFVNLFAHRRSEVADVVAGAAVSLARAKAGAVIAVERGGSLGKYVEGGVKLDARLSPELLTSIFMPGSPMQDGAAVVRGGKLAAAGCLLPLTDNPDAAKTLGARHRAAIGLTEETDAVAVLVSGETGKVALAFRGELVQDLSAEDLRSKLAECCAEFEAPAAVATPAAPAPPTGG